MLLQFVGTSPRHVGKLTHVDEHVFEPVQVGYWPHVCCPQAVTPVPEHVGYAAPFVEQVVWHFVCSVPLHVGKLLHVLPQFVAVPLHVGYFVHVFVHV